MARKRPVRAAADAQEYGLRFLLDAGWNMAFVLQA